jgi:hypothetical protein
MCDRNPALKLTFQNACVKVYLGSAFPRESLISRRSASDRVQSPRSGRL